MSSLLARNINWRREAIYPALALAETSIAAPWLLALLGKGKEIPNELGAAACLGIIFVTLYGVRLLAAFRVRVWIQRALVAAEILTLCAFGLRLIVFPDVGWRVLDWLRPIFDDQNALSNRLPVELLIVSASVWLCWRGMRLAERPFSISNQARRFQFGIVMLALLTLLNTIVIDYDITTFVPPFFFSQLLAVGLTRVEVVSLEPGGRSTPFTGWWLGMLAAPTLFILTVAGALSAAVIGIGPTNIFFWVFPFIAIVTLPFTLLLLPLLILIDRLVALIAQGMTGMGLPQAIRDIISFFSNLGVVPSSQTPPAIQTVLRILRFGQGVSLLTIILVVSVSVILIAGGLRALRSKAEDEEHESLWSGRGMLRKLSERLKQELNRFRDLAQIAERFGAGGFLSALTIRRMYAQTVKLAAERGYPRAPSRTPYEHLATLQQAIPGCDSEMAQVTEAYVRVHYGEVPETDQAMDEIRAAFTQIKTRAALVKKQSGPKDKPPSQQGPTEGTEEPPGVFGWE